MSQINWDVVQELGKQKAQRYADSKLKGKPKVDYVEALVFNAYFDGLMECAGERESLRVMVERARTENKGPWREAAVTDDGLEELV